MVRVMLHTLNCSIILTKHFCTDCSDGFSRGMRLCTCSMSCVTLLFFSSRILLTMEGLDSSHAVCSRTAWALSLSPNSTNVVYRSLIRTRSRLVSRVCRCPMWTRMTCASATRYEYWSENSKSFWIDSKSVFRLVSTKCSHALRVSSCPRSQNLLHLACWILPLVHAARHMSSSGTPTSDSCASAAARLWKYWYAAQLSHRMRAAKKLRWLVLPTSL